MIKKFIPQPIKKTIRYAQSIYYKGNKYICPFCNHSAKKMMPTGVDLQIIEEKQVIGAGKREAVCYRCFSKDRERMVFLYLKNELKVFENAAQISVLHIAPEPILTKEFKKHKFKKYTCGDLFTEGYIYPDYVENMDILNINYPENSFDLVICNHVLEHIEDDFQAMKELFRVLKPNGNAILLVPISNNSANTYENPTITSPEEKKQHFGQFDHCRIYGQDYPQRLEKAGFAINRINIADKYPKNALNPKEELFIGTK